MEVIEVDETKKEEEAEGQNMQETRKKENDNNRSDQGKNKYYYWMNTTCKFGDKCRSEHPTRCLEILEKRACSNGENCILVHLKIG